MNNVAKTLFSEHEVIAGAISILNDSDAYLETDPAKYEEITRGLLDFFRNYADKFHHSKEEEILFPEMIKKNELLEEAAIKEMLDNHEDFRIMLKNAELLLNSKDYTACSKLLHLYSDTLLNHIAVENEEVFQMLDTLFTGDELEKIYFRFEDSDNELGMDEKRNMEDFISKIEHTGKP